MPGVEACSFKGALGHLQECDTENHNMSTPTIHTIADELNERARAHPIGELQEIRGHRPGNDLFRVNSQTTQDRWACHWGGRTELQFNIGRSGSMKLRHGV